MTDDTPTIVLLHGAFAESASWNGVIPQLKKRSLDVLVAANPLRSLADDATYLRDVITAVGKPVILAGHCYAGMVMTEAASDNNAVVGLVYVSAFAPDHGESALDLTSSAPGSTLGSALRFRALSTGGYEFVIGIDVYQHQCAADVADDVAALMAATQRPVTEDALSAGLPTKTPAWKTIPSWFVFGDNDLSIPVAVHRRGAQRALSRGTREVAGASHSISVSRPDAVVATILDAVAELTA